MAKRKKKRPAKQAAPKLYVPEGLENVFGTQLIQDLKSRVNRKLGACASCGEKLGRFDLAFVAELHEGDVRGYGDWQVATCHRACTREAAKHSVTLVPQRTFTTALIALPIPQNDLTPSMVPTLLVNPSVDHFVVHKPRKGSAYDKTEEFLTKDCGFTVMSNEHPSPEEPTLTAYISGADVTIAHGESGQSWEHRQPESNQAVSEQLEQSLHEYVKAWDGMLVMASHAFDLTDPQKTLEQLPRLLNEGKVMAATASPEFREVERDLVDKAFKMAHSPMLSRADGPVSHRAKE